jgi:hypothetical protein
LLFYKPPFVLMPSNLEGRISLALHALSTGVCKSLNAAATSYDVPYNTLSRRYNGIRPQRGTRSITCKLTQTEEQVLLQRILDLDEQGFPPQLAVVRDIANIILSNCTKPPAQPIGKNWVARFVKRQPSLCSKYNRKYDYQRAMCEDPEQIQGWFRLVRNIVAKYGILQDDIYNFDETGFQMGVISTSKVVTRSERKGRPRTKQPDNREWVTIIHTIKACGWVLPPFVIFKAKLHQASWYCTPGLPGDWKIAVSDNGWTTNEIGLEWIKHFDKHTSSRTKGKYRLLVLDGHESHHSAQFEEYCRTNSIVTVCMPAHSSHILQPLDVGCFGPLKIAYGRQVEGLMRLGVNHISKEEFLTAYLMTHNTSFTTSNVQAGFAATGLVPYEPDRVLSTLHSVVRTPSPVPSAESAWESKTPQNLKELNRQATYIRSIRRQQRAGTLSPSDPAFNQLLKGFETVVHERAILLVENATLRTENQRQKRKRAQRRCTIGTGGSLSVQAGQDRLVNAEVQEQMEVEVHTAEIANSTNQQNGLRTKAPPRCSKCNSLEHTARTCK